jgi:hypothetical protein
MVGITFAPEHIAMILAGTKTQTRRINCKAYHVWRTYPIQPGRGRQGMGRRIEILDIHRELLGDIDLESARAEGYQSVEEYIEVWKRMNKKWDPGQEVYVITFKLVPQ